MNFMEIVMVVMVILMIVFLVRIFKGPSVWDRLLGLNLLSAKIIAIIIVFAYLSDTGYFLDVAIIYALFGFISEIFTALFLADRTKEQKEKEE